MKKSWFPIMFLVAIIINFTFVLSPSYATTELKAAEALDSSLAAAPAGVKLVLTKDNVAKYIAEIFDKTDLKLARPVSIENGMYGEDSLPTDEVKRVYSDSSPLVRLFRKVTIGQGLSITNDFILLTQLLQRHVPQVHRSKPINELTVEDLLQHEWVKGVLEDLTADNKTFTTIRTEAEGIRGQNFALFTSIERLSLVKYKNRDKQDVLVPWVLPLAIERIKKDPKLCFGQFSDDTTLHNIDFTVLSHIWWYALRRDAVLGPLVESILPHLRTAYFPPMHSLPKPLAKILEGTRLFLGGKFFVLGNDYVYGGYSTQVNDFTHLAKQSMIPQPIKEEGLKDILCHRGDCSSGVALVLALHDLNKAEAKGKTEGDKKQTLQQRLEQHPFVKHKVGTVHFRRASGLEAATDDAVEREVTPVLKRLLRKVEPGKYSPGHVVLYQFHVGIFGGKAGAKQIIIGNLNRHDEYRTAFKVGPFTQGWDWTVRPEEGIIGVYELVD